MGTIAKIFLLTSVNRKLSGSRPEWRLATSGARVLAAAIASSLAAKTQISFSTGTAPLNQSIENKASSIPSRSASAASPLRCGWPSGGRSPVLFSGLRDMAEQINAFETRLVRMNIAVADAMVTIPQIRTAQEAARIEIRNIVDATLFDMARLKGAVLQVVTFRRALGAIPGTISLFMRFTMRTICMTSLAEHSCFERFNR
jgi:hypothetical protein